MLKFKGSPFEDDIEKATHENNLTEDWALIMHICDNAINFDGGAKFCLKAIMKRLYHSVPRVVLHTLTLLDACVKNCDRRFLLQVASSEFTNEVRKLLPKMHPSASIKLKELLQRWSLEEFKDDPELCIIPSLYYKLKSEGVEFPPVEKEKKKTAALCTNPDGVSSQEEEEDIIKAIEISLKDTGRYEVPDEYKNISSTSSSKSFSEPMKVRALYDFDAAEDNELTIKTGEVIVVLDCCSPSWWKGSNHRGEGLFPSNFVTEDLDFKPEEPKVSELDSKTEAVSEVLEEVEVKLDEKKIELVLNWLNDVDPTEETSDPEEMLILEKQCYNMTPIIEEHLQAIDNRIAMLNLVNEKIMSAFDLFHSLSDMSPINQSLKYYTGTLNQHVVQFPHPQVTTLPHGTMLHQTVQPPVPQNLYAPATLPLSSNQIASHPVSTVQAPMMQEPQTPSTVSMSSCTTSHQAVTDVNQSIQTTVNTPTAAALPYSQTNPVYNFSVVGGYCMPSQAIPYPVQCPPNMQQPGYIQAPTSVPNVMTLPYTVPPMRPYFPFPYYYVNSNIPQQIPAASTEPAQGSDQKPASPTTASVVNTTASAIPVVMNYSNDLHTLSLSTSSTGDSHAEKQDMLSTVQKGMSDQQLPSDMSNSELTLKKNL